MVFALAGDSTTTTSILFNFLRNILARSIPDQMAIHWLKARILGFLDVARCVPPTLVQGELSPPAQATNGIGAPIRQPLPAWARAIRRVARGYGPAQCRLGRHSPRAYKPRVFARLA